MDRDEKIEWITKCIFAGNKYHWREKNPWVHNAINLGLAGAFVAAFVGTVLLGDVLAWGLYLPVASVLFGLLLFALFILVVHEASHNMFVLSADHDRQKFWNRVFGWAVCLLMAVHYTEHWEEGHLEHHLRPMEEHDPQKYNRETGRTLFTLLAKLVVIPGYAFYHRFANDDHDRDSHTGPYVKVATLAFWGSVFAVTGWTIGWTVPVALLMGLQILLALNHLKGALEHGGDIAFEENAYLRSRTSFFPLERIIMPLNINLHFEHHLNFTIPWYDLRDYHADVREIVPDELHDEFFNQDIAEQLSGEKGDLGEELREIAYGEVPGQELPTQA
jgi:fatty acid desaturase